MLPRIEPLGTHHNNHLKILKMTRTAIFVGPCTSKSVPSLKIAKEQTIPIGDAHHCCNKTYLFFHDSCATFLAYNMRLTAMDLFL